VIRSARAPFVFALLAVVALAAGACTPTAGPLGTPATPPPSSEPSVEAPTSDATPDTSAPSAVPTAAPTAASSGSPTETPAGSTGPTTPPAATATPRATATPAAGATIVRAYFFLGSFTDNAGLVPVLREVPKTKAVASAAMAALLQGPNDAEMSMIPAMYTTIPDGTKLLGISISNGVATVNLSREFESGGGAASILGRLAQVTYTLTQFPTVDSVLFQLDGKPVSTFSGEGVILDHPVDRADYYDQLPAIFVDRPAWGAAIGNPARVAGLANVFEAQFRVRLMDGSGTVLADKPVMASCGTGCWGTFKIDLAYTVPKAQYGTLRVYDISEKDGTVIDVTEYKVWLTRAP
jgi:germination protein M